MVSLTSPESAASLTQTQLLAERFELQVYPKRGVTFVRGQGAKLWDEAGREYIDCAAGIGVAGLGHAHEAVAEAISRQARRLMTCPGIFDNDLRSQLFARLVEVSPQGLSRVFLCNSGTEAVEAALKMARLCTGRTDFIAAARGFHGRTLGSLSATHNPEYRESFEPLVPGFSWVPFANYERLEAAVTDRTAGIILEVVQGEGGIHIGTSDYFHAVRDLCDRKGVLLIIDEIQSGFCRTGKFFACMHHELRPDMLCVAKAMAGGLPMGAMICNDRVPAAIKKHGSTFGGNPLCCAAALATIDFMVTHRLDEQAAQKGEYFMSRLRSHSLSKVREIRGLGLMIGIELKQKVKPILEELMTRGVVALSAGTTVIRLLPPLVIEQDELDAVADHLIRLLT